jgi:broad specificity phosphatase PhoE
VAAAAARRARCTRPPSARRCAYARGTCGSSRCSSEPSEPGRTIIAAPTIQNGNFVPNRIGPIKPSKVLLIRHGEKLGNPANDGSGGPDLSIQGSARAAALPALFAPASPELDCAIDGSDSSFTGTYGAQQLTGTEPRFDTLNVIIATADSTNSNRPRETATPTAMALGVTVRLHDKLGFEEKHRPARHRHHQRHEVQRPGDPHLLASWHHPNRRAAIGRGQSAAVGRQHRLRPGLGHRLHADAVGGRRPAATVALHRWPDPRPQGLQLKLGFEVAQSSDDK